MLPPVSLSELLKTRHPRTRGGDFFRDSLSIDGNLVVMGVPYDDSSGTNIGQVHLFDAVNGALLQTFDDPVTK